MQTYLKRIDVRVCLALAAGALLLAWTIGCPPPRHPDNFGEGGGGIGDDDDATGDDDDIGDDDDYDNFVTCMEWLDSMECNGFDFGEFIDCNTFAEWPCDLTDYFDCLADETVCEGDFPDVSGWANCEDLAICD